MRACSTRSQRTHRDRIAGYGVNSDNPADVLWNFEKFSLSRKGEVEARFAPDATADDPRLVSAGSHVMDDNSGRRKGNGTETSGFCPHEYPPVDTYVTGY
jgi:hypothetical protein